MTGRARPVQLPMFPEPPAKRPGVLDPDEAPAGYVAVLKRSARPPGATDNFCHYCDYRPTCQTNGPETYDKPHLRCSAEGVVLADGRIIQRADECSVVFKRKEQP